MNMFDALAEALRQNLNRGMKLDDALATLRRDVASIIDSIKALQRASGCSLAEAKHKVHFSAAWSDLRAAHDRLHDDLDAHLDELIKEEEE